MLLSYIISSTEKAINYYLASDPEKAAGLNIINGKILAITLLPWHKTFFIHILPEHRLHLTPNCTIPPHLTISGPPLSLLNLLKQTSTEHLKNIHFSGDLELAQVLKKVFHEIDFDLEAVLAQYTSSSFAVNALKPFRYSYYWQKNASQSLQRQVSEYLQEETQLLPTQEALTQFYQQVDTLRDDVERLAIRIHLLSTSELC